jgi:hypothetical protein
MHILLAAMITSPCTTPELIMLSPGPHQDLHLHPPHLKTPSELLQLHASQVHVDALKHCQRVRLK